MKKTLITSIIIFFILVGSVIFSSPVFASANPAFPDCLDLQGQVNVDQNFPAGGTVTVSCNGSDSECVGSSEVVGPGKTFDLPACDCLAGVEGKCLQVNDAPDGCTTDIINNSVDPRWCGTNGQPPPPIQVGVTCKPPASTATQAPATQTPTASPTPQCTANQTSCSCTGTSTASCSTCMGGTCNNGVCSTCSPAASPSPSASPSPTPYCGMSCTSNQKCENLTGCTACINGTCQAPTPTPTPTPEFNTAACQCDGLTTSSLVPGAQATVNAHYKITGADQSKAKITSVSFVMYEGDNSTGKSVAQSGPIPISVASINNNETEYVAQWTFTVPANVNFNTVYRVMSTSDCQASGLTQTSMTVKVADVSTSQNSQPKTKPQNLWTKIMSLFENVFGLNKQAASTNITSQVLEQPTPTQNASTDSRYSVQENQLQLGTFKPAQQLQAAACNILRFQFSQ